MGTTPLALPYAYNKQEVGTPDQLQHNALQRQSVVFVKVQSLQKGWIFRVGIWNIDSLPGRAKVVKMLGDINIDVGCVPVM